MPEGKGLKKSPAMTRLSLNRLRYPGHDTLECFSSSRLYRPVLNSKWGFTSSVLDATS